MSMTNQWIQQSEAKDQHPEISRVVDVLQATLRINIDKGVCMIVPELQDGLSFVHEFDEKVELRQGEKLTSRHALRPRHREDGVLRLPQSCPRAYDVLQSWEQSTCCGPR